MSSIFSSPRNKSNNNTPRKNTKSPSKERGSPRINDIKTALSKERSNNRGIKISQHMIYDSAPTNRLILKEYIQTFGGVVTEVDNSNDVITNIKSHGEYNIIWVDIPMPEMGSLECISYLRNCLKYTGAIIGLIGYTDNHTRELCYNTDINHLITKPFDLMSINAYIEKYSQ